MLVVDMLIMGITWRVGMVKGKYFLRPLIATKISHLILNSFLGALFALLCTNNSLKIFTIFMTGFMMGVLIFLDYKVIKVCRSMIRFEVNSSKIKSFIVEDGGSII
jgi:hypothetical protein